MNVIFHVITGATIATAISPKKHLFGGFILGVLSHGVLDFIPHQYPLSSEIDILISILMMASILLLIKKNNRIIFAACFLGILFPDLVDLGPAMINKFIGTSLPTIKLFPWHWSQYSGSIFDDSNSLLSNILHIAVLGGSLSVFFYFNKHEKF